MIHPPPFVPTRTVKCRYRFIATAASTSDQLTATSFLDLLCVAATTTSAYQLGNFFKIDSIEIWGPMASDLAPVTCQIEWNGSTAGAFGKSVVHSDTSMGASVPAHVRSQPPVGSQLAQWLSAGAFNIALLKYPAKSVVDVHFSLVLRDDAAATAVTGAVAAATVGALYVRALNSPTSTNLLPLGVSTI